MADAVDVIAERVRQGAPRCSVVWGDKVHRTLIRESVLRKWLAANGGAESDVQGLVQRGHLLRVEADGSFAERFYRTSADQQPYCLNADRGPDADTTGDGDASWAVALSQRVLVAALAWARDPDNVAVQSAHAEAARALVLAPLSVALADNEEARQAAWLNLSGALFAASEARFGAPALGHCCYLVAGFTVSLREMRCGILRDAATTTSAIADDSPKRVLCGEPVDAAVCAAARHPALWTDAGPWAVPLDRARLAALVERSAAVAPCADEGNGDSADPFDLLPDVPQDAQDALVGKLLAGLDAAALARLQQRVRAERAALAAIAAQLVEQRAEEPRGRGAPVPRLLKAGGQGFRLWKAPHDALVTELSSRAPPAADLAVAPQVRGDAERFRAELRATVGALAVSEKAGRVMQEMLNSEREYFTDLGMLHRLYVQPLSEGARTRGYFITERDLEDLFSNFDDIFRLNLEFLRQLEVELKKPPGARDAGQLFLAFADRFQIYALYCANANAAKKRMEALAAGNKRFAEFCEKARSHSAHKGLDIGSFLIKPLQRLCQYPLLLRELLEALPDQQTEPYARLQAAHRVMAETVETVNGMLKSIRKRAELQRLGDLLSNEVVRCVVAKPGRQFVAVGTFRVRLMLSGRKESNKWRVWECWLLSDLLAMGERHPASAKHGERLLLKAWVPLEMCELVTESTGPSAGGAASASGGPDTSRHELIRADSTRAMETARRTVRAPRDALLLLVADGSRICLACDDKAQLTLWGTKIAKKLALIKRSVE